MFGPEFAWLGNVGGWGGMVLITSWLFWMLATGRLYTRNQHESIVKLHSERFQSVKEVLDITLAQNTALIEGGGAAKEFFEKVPVTRKSRGKPVGSSSKDETGDTGVSR